MLLDLLSDAEEERKDLARSADSAEASVVCGSACIDYQPQYLPDDLNTSSSVVPVDGSSLVRNQAITRAQRSASCQ